MSAPDASLRDAVASLLGDRDLAWSPDTTFTRRSAPFLRRHGVWALDHAGEAHALFLFVAWVEGEPAQLLSGRPAALADLARAEGATIATPEAALEYALWLLEVTRDPGPLLTVLRSAADLPVRPHPTAEEEAALDALEIAPPRARAVPGGFAVTLQVARDDALVRVAVAVAPDGGVSVAEQALAEGLPLVSS